MSAIMLTRINNATSLRSTGCSGLLSGSVIGASCTEEQPPTDARVPANFCPSSRATRDTSGHRPPAFRLSRQRRQPVLVLLSRQLAIDMRPDQAAECAVHLPVFALARFRAVLGQEFLVDDIGEQLRIGTIGRAEQVVESL